jgi:hypothetical protein
MSSVKKVKNDYSIELYENESDIPDRFRGKVQENEMLMNARSLTSDFLPKPWLSELAQDSYNQRVLWRHKDPESEEDRGRVYGRILETDIEKFEDEGEEKEVIDSWYRLFGDTEIERKLQDYIRKKHEKGETIGISKGYIVNKDPSTGDISRVFALEDSITYKPQDKNALTQRVIQMEDEESKMTNMTKEEQEEEDKEIEQLEKELNNAKLQLEEKDEKLEELESKVSEFESLIEKKESQKMTLEDKLVDLKDQLKEMESNFEEYKERQEKETYLERVKELEKSQDIYDPEIFEFEAQWSKEKLQERISKLEEREQEAHVATKTIREEREEILEEQEEHDIGADKAFRNNRELREMVKKEMENSGVI